MQLVLLMYVCWSAVSSVLVTVYVVILQCTLQMFISASAHIIAVLVAAFFVELNILLSIFVYS
jgi:hypothetical protein